ncbi:MAG: hypothetical protein Q8R07_01820, partial [Candidatus Uhrbacteria bacterium]|nr:hypothetical protein [Candidatus Uhrbacteria bacterium]
AATSNPTITAVTVPHNLIKPIFPPQNLKLSITCMISNATNIPTNTAVTIPSLFMLSSGSYIKSPSPSA